MTVTREQILKDCQLYLKDTDINIPLLAEIVYKVYSTAPQERSRMLGEIKPTLTEDNQLFVDNVARLVTHYDNLDSA
jgi:hypothetical protein